MPLLVILSTSTFSQQIIQNTPELLVFTASVTLVKGTGRMEGESWRDWLILPGGGVYSHIAGKDGRPDFCEMDEVGTLEIKLEKNMTEAFPGDRKEERERYAEWCERYTNFV